MSMKTFIRFYGAFLLFLEFLSNHLSIEGKLIELSIIAPYFQKENLSFENLESALQYLKSVNFTEAATEVNLTLLSRTEHKITGGWELNTYYRLNFLSSRAEETYSLVFEDSFSFIVIKGNFLLEDSKLIRVGSPSGSLVFKGPGIVLLKEIVKIIC